MEDVEIKRKKTMSYMIIVLISLFTLVIGATYAYFTITTNNNFGTTTITGVADSTGSVTLSGTNATIRLNLSRVNMMRGNYDITYWGTSTGDPSTTQNVVIIGSTSVTGNEIYDCNYSLSVTASGTNNMYDSFQEMDLKGEEQIVLKVGHHMYDFNKANLFPITINGTFRGLTSSNIQNITSEFYLVNTSYADQSALAGNDITITITATNFSCTATSESVFWGCDSDGQTDVLDTPNDEWQGFIRETNIGSNTKYELCWFIDEEPYYDCVVDPNYFYANEISQHYVSYEDYLNCDGNAYNDCYSWGGPYLRMRDEHSIGMSQTWYDTDPYIDEDGPGCWYFW